MSKLYFAKEIDEINCYDLNTIKDIMQDEGIQKTELIQAERETGNGFFYCKELQEVGEVGLSCGIICDHYKPRNGKNGRCTHSGYTYLETEIKRIIEL